MAIGGGRGGEAGVMHVHGLADSSSERERRGKTKRVKRQGIGVQNDIYEETFIS